MRRRRHSWLSEGAGWLANLPGSVLASIRVRQERRSSAGGPLRQMWHAIPFWVRGVMLLGAGLSAGILTAVLMRYYLPPAPEQPIPFSHRFHVSSRQINCFFCHPGAQHAASAGVPPVEKCMLCHSVIIPDFPAIKKLSGYYFSAKPVPWKRIYRLPDYVHFSHQIHIARGFDCSECHGDVKAMQRVGKARVIDMNFCVGCHWRNGASDSCFRCHY